MDIARAKELLSALADGIDPFTGELLPQNHVFNQHEMIRAFHEVLNVIPSPKKKVCLGMLENHGRRLRKKSCLTNLTQE